MIYERKIMFAGYDHPDHLYVLDLMNEVPCFDLMCS